MDQSVTVSAIIPTYNRRERVALAIRSVLAQTYPVLDIIVVDDGSSDGTQAMLAKEFGGRIRYHWQPNAGVSAARNAGLRLATGQYLAFLDSDDEWVAEKTAQQLSWLRQHPDFGMVVCDVLRVDASGRKVDVFQRRRQLPFDGHLLRQVICHPSLAPSSVMLPRSTYDRLGGFDESLRTAEDLEFHIRVAAHFKIGVVERSLTRSMWGHDGLSALSQTYGDDVHVIETAVQTLRARLPGTQLRHAQARAYLRQARGMALGADLGLASKLTYKALSTRLNADVLRRAISLLPLAALVMLRRWRDRLTMN